MWWSRNGIASREGGDNVACFIAPTSGSGPEWLFDRAAVTGTTRSRSLPRTAPRGRSASAPAPVHCPPARPVHRRPRRPGRLIRSATDPIAWHRASAHAIRARCGVRNGSAARAAGLPLGAQAGPSVSLPGRRHGGMDGPDGPRAITAGCHATLPAVPAAVLITAILDEARPGAGDGLAWLADGRPGPVTRWGRR
jgi:hypothetical protein